MANNTIYPYGTSGQLPSNIGVINDLKTGGTDKALSAQMGKEIGELIYTQIESIVDTSSLTIRDCTLGGSKKWYKDGTKGKHIAVPVTAGTNYGITTSVNGGYYGWVTSSYNPPYATDSTVPYVSGEDRTWCAVGVTKTVTAPAGAAYLILCTVDGSGNSTTWSVIEDYPTTIDIWRKQDFSIIDDLKTGGSTDVLSAEQGKLLGDEVFEDEIIQLDLSSVALTNTFVDTATNKWSSYQSKYQGKFLDVSAYKGKKFKIGNYKGTTNWFYRFALLKNNSHTSGQVPSYSSTSPFNALITINSADASAQWYEGTIPNDVNYIYIYCYNADSTPSYMPPELHINLGSFSRIDAISEAVVGLPSINDVWFEKRSDSYLYQAPASDCWKNQTVANDGTIYYGNNAQKVACFPRSASISAFTSAHDFYDVQELPSSTLEITSAEMDEGYYVNVNVAQYTKNLTFIKRESSYISLSSSNDWTTSITLEGNCRYFKIMALLVAGTVGSGTNVAFADYIMPSGFIGFKKATITQESVPTRISVLDTVPFAKVRVCSWNLGHFALGASYDTAITAANYEEMKTKWRVALNELSPDILLACEYSTIFAKNPDITARDAIFNNFKYAKIGSTPSATSYMQTATFSNVEPINTYEDVYPNTVQAGRYYQCSDMYIGGKLTKVVITHLDWNEGTYGADYRADQIARLIQGFKAYEHVIICGDFNVASSNEYDDFITAGFSIVNHGYLGDIATFPAGDATRPLDTIIVKGFAISNIGKFDDSTLSDHDAIYCDLIVL